MTAGFTFELNLENAPNTNRIGKLFRESDKSEILPEDTFLLATSKYVSDGLDGFDVLKESK